jgi:hypothetical protein
MLYEKLRCNKAGFCRDISEFLKLPAIGSQNPRFAGVIHRSFSDISIRILRMVNRLEVSPAYPSPSLNIRNMRRYGKAVLRRFDYCIGYRLETHSIYERVKRRFEGEFFQSNRKVESLLNIDLRSFGYE